MNKKFYVPLETAQLLDQKGYPQDGCDMYYNNFGELIGREKLVEDYKRDYTTMVKYNYAAPAYCEVIDWLVEKEIYINTKRRYELVTNDEEIVDGYMLWYCSVYSYSINIPYFIMFTEKFKTREEAINDAIIKVLEKLQ